MKVRYPRVRERIRQFFALDPERPLYTHGPVVRVALVAIVVSSLVAIAGLVFSFVAYSNRLDAIQTSRIESAADTCRTLRQVIDQAYRPMPHRLQFSALINGKHAVLVLTIPQNPTQTAASQIKADGLENCAAHARKQTALGRGN